MTRVLVVDDEANIRELVSVYLVSAGYSVDTAKDGSAALAALEAAPPDLVVLDIMLPIVDGLTVCRRIRERGPTPVIMLTARDTDIDKVALLEAGADDYIVKPFSPPELVARVRAVLRRSGEPESSQASGAPITVGALVITPETREVTLGGAHVALTTREFDLLATMAARPGVVFSRAQLIEAATGFDDYVDERGVDVHIRHLREKLGDDASAPRFIDTVRGVGYRVRRETS